MLHGLQTIAQHGLNLSFQHVGALTNQWPLIAGQLAHRPQDTGQSALLAEQTDPQLVQRFGISS